MIDPPPGDVGHMEQAVDAAEIHEGAVVGNVLDHALENLSLGEVGNQLRAFLGAGFLQHRAAGDDDVPAGAVHLENLEWLRAAHQRSHVPDRADIHLAAGQERDGAGKVDGKPALDPAEDDAFYPCVVFEGFLEDVPRFLAAGLLAAQDNDAVPALEPLHEYVDAVARHDGRRGAGFGKFLDRDRSFGLQPHVDEDEIVLDRQYEAVHHFALKALFLFKSLVEEVGKIFAGHLLGDVGGEIVGVGIHVCHVQVFLRLNVSLAGRLTPAVFQRVVGARSKTGNSGACRGRAARTRSSVILRRDMSECRFEHCVGVFFTGVDDQCVLGRLQRRYGPRCIPGVAVL